MNKNTVNAVIGVIVVVILVALGIWYFNSSNTAGTATPEQTATTTTTVSTTVTNTSAATPASPTTFKSIFTQSGNHECTYEQVGTSTQSSSVIYISNGDMRGEFRTTGTVTSADLMIYNGGYLYSWKEGATVGKKSSIKSLADLPQVIPQDLTSGAIFGVSTNNVSWDCHDWITDPTFFVLPTYVTFS